MLPSNAAPLAPASGTKAASAIDRALALPSGARFRRCALQVNPHGYAEKFRGQPNALTEAQYVEAIMAKCVELRIEAIALTDHGSAAAFEQFRVVGQRHDVTVFPGFELTSSEGVHVLCLYDPSTSAAEMAGILGAFGIRRPEATSAPVDDKFAAILRKVQEQHGLTVAAHVTTASGLFTTLKGQACIKAWRDPHLLAVSIPGTLAGLPADKSWKDILQNAEPNYRREHPAASDLAVAVVNACDVKAPEDLEKPAASCWIKMTEISVEGLRQAFLDPESRIRLAGDERWEDHAEVTAVTWEGGFLDGAAIHFSGNLNVLVGGRGTGKSTVLESIRYAMGLTPVGEDARQQHENVVSKVLRSGTKVSIEVCSRVPTRTEYRIERTVPNPPVVRDRQGAVLNVRPVDVMPRMEIYGQHEIAELTKSPEKLTRLLERFVATDVALPGRMAEAQRELERSRKQLGDVRDELRRVEERLAALPAVEETLKQYQAAGVEARLHDQSMIVREERVLRTAAERIQSVRELAEGLKRRDAIDVAFVSARALADLPAAATLREIEPALATLSADVVVAADALDAAVRRADGAIANVRGVWDVRRQSAQAEYERVLRDLQKSRIDGQEFIRLRTQLEELTPLIDRRDALARNASELETRRRSLVVEWEDAKAQEYQQLDKASVRVNRALDRRVRVRVVNGGERKLLADVLREEVGGTLAPAIRALQSDATLSLRELADHCRGPGDRLAQRYKLPRAQADRLAERGDALAMRIEELRLAPTTHLELNVATEGQIDEWRSLDELSSGQKATAVLLLVLLESDAPLLVDQPEDDLDNRFITDGVVPTMRRGKRKRQYLITTHNANIPVLGDAELIVGLSTRSQDGRVVAVVPSDRMGAIDAPRVRELVEELLEGGRAAFEMRQRKYRF